ncbi:A/G-specific adenine glycosylase [Desulfoplanes formicivorans]|uniref:Adenine DNA glycosylase n=1 Tax=Desulfoplanes formicivorans TaxID=1592317 RepID=A0A194AJP7_9BACT|nr:A/G-specific adenine glycosylase [Desulfoplanes formicivorans]GAU09465.1 adenine glycosylase [Desulfoplanes formicivorans]
MDFAHLFQNALLDWFATHRRDLPWRRDYAPYKVWISEIMLQQTQMERGVEYFNRWMARFPDIRSVALAHEDEILRAWEGLGYYRRARNLHKTARIIVADHNGVFPRQPDELAALPGIGPYTAAAIASIAFEKPVPVVDANVSRVLARIFDVDTLITARETRSFITAQAARLLPASRARDFNQAIMELGALVCKKSPVCIQCPLQSLCASLEKGNMLERPVTPKPPTTIPLTMVAGVLVHQGQVFIQKRPDNAVWANLWEFPGGKVIPGEPLETAVAREFFRQTRLSVIPGRKVAEIKHSYTRYRITLHAFCCSTNPPVHPVLHTALEYRWVRPDTLNQLAFPTSHRKLIRLLFGSSQHGLHPGSGSVPIPEQGPDIAP